MRLFQHFVPNPKQSARFYARVAVRALYDELSLYPKPGLVSLVDSGAHKDMDGLLFLRSLFGLRHYFFHIGFQAALGKTPQQLVLWGKQAEQRMYQITKGVNTHRGAIFSLGILCSSLCRLSVQKQGFTLDEVQQEIIDFWSYYLKNHHENTNTHGALVKERYGVPDAKRLAIEGYQSVFQIYKSLQTWKEDKVFFGLIAYQRLLLSMEDINVLYRLGPKGLAFARQTISQAITIEDKEASLQAAIKIHHLFSEQNISPGGVADMLSMLYFLSHLFKSPLTKKNKYQQVAKVDL